MKLPRLDVHLRRPTRRELATIVPIALVVVVFLVLLARNADTLQFPDYEVPEGFTPAPPPTTAVPGAPLPTLAVVAGTTTTVLPPNQGTAALSGVVAGPQGPVPGATVRIERAIAGQIQRLDVPSAVDGTWVVPGLGGGSYRVRAFLPPQLAQRTAEVFFLTAGEQRAVDLVVESFSEPAVAVGVAPDPPLLDQPLNLAIQVTTRTVDADGVVRVQPLVGAAVEVATAGGWQREATTTTSTSTTTSTPSTSSSSSTTPSSSSSTTSTSSTSTTSTTAPPPVGLLTDENGRVTVRYVCRAPGPVQLSVTVRPTPDAVPTVVVPTVPDCIDPATTTTIPPPTTPSTAAPN